MDVLTPQSLKDYLLAKASLHRLKQDLVLFYAHQTPTTAVWLHQGIIRLNFEGSKPKDCFSQGLYFLDELSKEKSMRYSAKVLAGAQIWIVTRTEIQHYLLCL